MKDHKIAVVEADGTGQEVSDVFKRTVSHIYKCAAKKDVEYISFLRNFHYRPHSFSSLIKEFHDKSYGSVKKVISKELADLKTFFHLSRKNAVGLFRSAVNAETLYYLRRDMKKLKLMVLPIKTRSGTRRVFFIRDQIQGFYTNENIRGDSISIKASFDYSQKAFNTLAGFVEFTVKKYGLSDFDLWFVYKFHLFGFELQKMITRAVQRSGLKPSGWADIFQPDTGLHKLLNELPDSRSNKDIVMVVGNEIGDVLLETLINYYDLGTKETLFALNFAFADQKKMLEVLQTVHGSADDMAGTNLMDPSATMRAAAYALENWLKVSGSIKKMDQMLGSAKRKNIVKTNEVVDFVLSNWRY